jgi:hypothetical protein
MRRHWACPPSRPLRVLNHEETISAAQGTHLIEVGRETTLLPTASTPMLPHPPGAWSGPRAQGRRERVQRSGAVLQTRCGQAFGSVPRAMCSFLESECLQMRSPVYRHRGNVSRKTTRKGAPAGAADASPPKHSRHALSQPCAARVTVRPAFASLRASPPLPRSRFGQAQSRPRKSPRSRKLLDFSRPSINECQA